jgi:hypothetical protein
MCSLTTITVIVVTISASSAQYITKDDSELIISCASSLNFSCNNAGYFCLDIYGAYVALNSTDNCNLVLDLCTNSSLSVFSCGNALCPNVLGHLLECTSTQVYGNETFTPEVDGLFEPSSLDNKVVQAYKIHPKNLVPVCGTELCHSQLPPPPPYKFPSDNGEKTCIGSFCCCTGKQVENAVETVISWVLDIL